MEVDVICSVHINRGSGKFFYPCAKDTEIFPASDNIRFTKMIWRTFGYEVHYYIG